MTVINMDGGANPAWRVHNTTSITEGHIMADHRIARDSNRISIPLFRQANELRIVCTMLYQAVHDRGYSDLILDFSNCEAATEAAMLPLLPIVAKMREVDRIDFSLIEPDDETLRRLFTNANWSHHLEPGNHEQTRYEGQHFPAHRYEEGDSWDDITERVLSLVLRELSVDRTSVAAVEWSLGEIMDNVINHAESPIGGFVQATTFRGSNRVEFIVADAGIGIPASMNITRHDDALMQAIAEGTTRNQRENAGNGLFGSYRVAALSAEGQFEINSGFGHLYYDRNQEAVQSKHRATPYNGTAIRCGIGLGNPDLLQSALKFRGEVYHPAYDVVERRFEDDAGGIVFSVRSEARGDIGSRHGGRRIRQVIENLLRDQATISIDFNGVGVISSSFADEVFGRLFVSLGPRRFMRRIEIVNAAPMVEGLIDRAILQRTKLGNGETDECSSAGEERS